MGIRGLAAYVFRHGWFWPFFFWQKPFAMVSKINQEDLKLPQLWSGLFGGAFWGFLAGLLIWQATGNVQPIWVTPIAFALAVAGVFATTGVDNDAFVFTLAEVFAIAGAVVGAVFFGVDVYLDFAVDFNFIFAVDATVIGTFIGAIVGAFISAVDDDDVDDAFFSAFADVLAGAVVGAVVGAFGAGGVVAFVLGVLEFIFSFFARIVSLIASVVVSFFCAFFSAVIGAFIGSAIVSGARAGARIFSFAGTGAFAVATVVLLFFGALGISLGLCLPYDIQSIISLIILIGSVVISLWMLLVDMEKKYFETKWLDRSWIICWLILLPLGGFIYFPRLGTSGATVCGAVICFFLQQAVISGFFELFSCKDNHRPKKIGQNQSSFLTLCWVLGTLLTLAAWFLSSTTLELERNLKILALLFIFFAPVGTGLPFYPFLALVSWRQGRRTFQPNIPPKLLASRWQTFAYPLPGIYSALRGISRTHGMKMTAQVLQEIQLRSMQGLTAARAARLLAAEPETGLSLCGEMVVTTNRATLVSLALAGEAAQAVAVLAKKDAEEVRQPLDFYFGKLPEPKANSLSAGRDTSRFGRGPFGLGGIGSNVRYGKKIDSWIIQFQDTRRASLVQRLSYSLVRLDHCKDYNQACEFRALLIVLHKFISASSVSALSSLRVDSINPQKIYDTLADCGWLVQGYDMARSISGYLTDLALYRDFSDVSSRKEFLQRKIAVLKKEGFKNLSWYWSAIGREILDHWTKLLSAEAQQAREWLSLSVAMPEQFLRVGRCDLLLDVRNTSGVTATNITLRVEAGDGLHCGVHVITQRLLEANRDTRLTLPLETSKPGEYRLSGELQARDLDDAPVTVPFSFRLNVGLKGKLFVLPPYAPYVTGEGFVGDETFVGRGELLRDLHMLWKQPGGKPAVMLVGQRRIGKTTLLNKIKRDGLGECGLLPIMVSIQDCDGEYDFLQEVARKTAQQLSIAEPVLDRNQPRADFKSFVYGLNKPLAGRRFLLMLDEADLLPGQHLGTLPGFLRGMMQSPDYPTLLLFCGTYNLKRMGREYDSILFNTVHEFTVSYLTETESAELLVKPARGILEFDPLTLREAHRLTHGQPLLLQLLGATIIRDFSTVIYAGQKRTNYVDLNDLTKAVETIVQNSNPAFLQHWEDSVMPVQVILSVLAWGTDERDRLGLDVEAVQSALKENRLNITGKELFEGLQGLEEEQVLITNGLLYSFAVPLYRRWIAKHWTTAEVRSKMHTIDSP